MVPSQIKSNNDGMIERCIIIIIFFLIFGLEPMHTNGVVSHTFN